MSDSSRYAFAKEALNLMRDVDPEPSHAAQVTRLALILFDRLRELHGLGAEERALLEAGGYCHDIGWAIGGKGHNKKSRDMVLEHRWQSASPRQAQIIASLARYHRKAAPNSKHDEYDSLGSQDQEVVMKLAPLLRIADGLDRSHQDRVRDIEVEITPGACLFRLVSLGACSTEIWGAERKSDLFEEVYQLEPRFQQRDG